MLKVISGGQTGVDQAALRAALACQVATGGWAPRGWLTERGPEPRLAEFGLEECPEGRTPAERYRTRTAWNVRDSDATLWLGSDDSAGRICTLRACDEFGRPRIIVTGSRNPTPRAVADWIIEHRVGTLNCAGPRESRKPGIGTLAFDYLSSVFALLSNLDGGNPC